jgi:hypothetical protein
MKWLTISFQQTPIHSLDSLLGTTLHSQKWFTPTDNESRVCVWLYKTGRQASSHSVGKTSGLSDWAWYDHRCKACTGSSISEMSGLLGISRRSTIITAVQLISPCHRWTIAADIHTGFHSYQLKTWRSGSSGDVITNSGQLRSWKTLPGRQTLVPVASCWWWSQDLA